MGTELRVAFVACAATPTEGGGFAINAWSVDVISPGMAVCTTERLAQAVRDAAPMGDFVVVSLHAGDEYVTTPNATQRALADAAFRPVSAKPKSAKKATTTAKKAAKGARGRAKALTKGLSKGAEPSAKAKPSKSGARRAAAARTGPAAKRKSRPSARPRRLTK